MQKHYLLTLLFGLSCLTIKADIDPENWMADLPDSMHVSMVSIPGAHDAATGTGFLDAGNYFASYSSTLSSLLSLNSTFGEACAQTQDLTIVEQLSAGVRAFDLRPYVNGEELNINHGIVQTKTDFNVAIDTLISFLKNHSEEFIVIHMLECDEDETEEEDYAEILFSILEDDSRKDYFTNFQRNLKVADVRGKILILSRDDYSDYHDILGGVMSGWVGYISWSNQKGGTITGEGTDDMATSPLYMQDYSDTHESGGTDTKVEAIETLLGYTTTKEINYDSNIVWAFNFASAYSKISSLSDIVGDAFGSWTSTVIGWFTEALESDSSSLSDGYRDNATYTNAAIYNYLTADDYVAGPTGILMCDYIGVDTSTGYDEETYNTMGASMLTAIIENNFNYIDRLVDDYTEEANNLINTCTEILDNSEPGADSYATALNEAIETAEADLEEISALTTTPTPKVDRLRALIATLEEARETYVENATPNSGYQFDMTYLIENPSFETGDGTGWTYTNLDDTNVYELYNSSYDIDNSDGAYLFNTWTWNSSVDADLSQSLSSMPIGYYTLTALVNSYSGTTITLTANDATASLTSATEGTGEDLTVETIKVSDGTMEIAVSAARFFKADNFRLYYTSSLEASELYESLQELLTEANSMITDEVATTDSLLAELQECYTEYSEYTEETSESVLTEAVSTLSDLIETVEESVELVAEAKASIEVGWEYYNNSEETVEGARDSYGDALTAAESAIDAAATTDELNEIIDEIEAARQEYVFEAYPINDFRFDMTFTITNADLSSSDGWTYSSSGRSTNSTNGNVVEYYAGWSSVDVESGYNYQAVTLPDGEYELDGFAFFRYCRENYDTQEISDDITTGYMFADGDTITVENLFGEAYDSSESYANSMAEAGTAFYTDSLYLNTLAFTLYEDTTINVGYSCEFTQYGSWFIFGSMNLYMTGAPSTDSLYAELVELLERTKPFVEGDSATTDSLLATLSTCYETYSTYTSGTSYSLLYKAVTKLSPLVEVAEYSPSLVAALDSALVVDWDYYYYSEETEYGAQEAYGEVLSEIQAVADSAMTVGAISTFADLVDELEEARQEYVFLAYPTDDFRFDMTFTITNADLTSIDGWTDSGSSVNTDNGTVREFYAGWGSLNLTSGYIYQEVTLPDGEYELEGFAFFRYGFDYAADPTISTGYLFAGEDSIAVATLGSATLDSYANDMTAAGSAFYDSTSEYYSSNYLNTLEFTLYEDTTINIGYTVTFDYMYSWFIFGSLKLYMTGGLSADTYLEEELAIADSLDLTTNVGDSIFQIPQALADSVTVAVSTANSLLADDTSTDDELTAAVKALRKAIANFEDPELNAPADDERVKMFLKSDGIDETGNALTFLYSDDKEGDGDYDLTWKYADNDDFAQAFIFTSTGTKNQYYISFYDADDVEHFICTQAAAGYTDSSTGSASTRTDRVRLTTDSAAALAVDIIVTSEQGIWNIYNTENESLMGRSQNDAGFYSIDTYADLCFGIADQAYDTLSITTASNGYATLMLPYNADVPEGLTVYNMTGLTATDDDDINIVVYEEAETIEANTPYLLQSDDATYTFAGYGLAADSTYATDYMTGTLFSMTAPEGTFVLQNHNDTIAFYEVDYAVAEPTMAANRAYLNATASTEEANIRIIMLPGDYDNVTGIESVNTADNSETTRVNVYNLNGMLIRSDIDAKSALKGLPRGIYIVNGKKTAVK